MTKTVTAASLPGGVARDLLVGARGRIELKTRCSAADSLVYIVAAASGPVPPRGSSGISVQRRGSDYNLDVLQRVLLAGRVICFYFYKIVWPANLIFTYPHWTVDPGRSRGNGAVPDVGLALLALWFWRIRARARQLARRPLFFGGSLFPVLGFLDIYPFRYSRYVADHFAYLASLGVIVPLSAGIAIAFERVRDAEKRRYFQFGVGMLLLVLATLTNIQSRMYTDPKTLYRTTIAKNPDDWMAHQKSRADLRARREVSRGIDCGISGSDPAQA